MREKGRELLRRYREDPVFQARFGLYRGTAITGAYVILKFISAGRYHSPWFFAVGVYYLSLWGIKLYLIRRDKALRGTEPRDAVLREEWRAYRRAGLLMLLIDLAISGIIVQVVRDRQTYSYPGTLIFAMAAWAFYKIIAAVIRFLRRRKERGPIFSAVKVIDLSAAAMSIYALQTALISTYSPDWDAGFYNALTGTAVAAVVTASAILMLVKGSRTLGRHT